MPGVERRISTFGRRHGVPEVAIREAREIYKRAKKIFGESYNGDPTQMYRLQGTSLYVATKMISNLRLYQPNSLDVDIKTSVACKKVSFTDQNFLDYFCLSGTSLYRRSDDIQLELNLLGEFKGSVEYRGAGNKKRA